MFSELIQSVADQYDNNLPFVVYRKPKEQTVHAIFQKDAQLHSIKNFEETGFIFSPFNERDETVVIPADRKEEAVYVSQISSKKIDEVQIDTAISAQQFHINLVQKGIAEIKNKSFKKVVLSRVLKVNGDASAILLFQKLLDRYANAFCYLWHHPAVGTWLGATPEILLQTENQQLTTMSLAGTKKYVKGQLPEWGSKETEEQQLVTDYIAKALENKVTNLNIAERASAKAGNLWHLRTKLTATFEKGKLAAIIQALHPTPAVCGLPKIPAKKFILKHENYKREFYTGYLGELNFKVQKDRSSSRKNQENKAYQSIKTCTTLFVNLRCMQLKNRQAHIYIGGGVTQDSDAEKEWQETVAKSMTMLYILQQD